MSTYNTRDFSKFTNSPRSGGAVEYYSDNHVLKVTHENVVSRLSDTDPGSAMIIIRETGAQLRCEVTGYQYYDTAKTEIKTYILTPSEIAKKAYPEYANISVHITIFD